MKIAESKSENSEKQIVITACGGKLKDPANYPSADYRSDTIYFCTHACLRAFKKDPDSFMAGDVEHPTEKD